jgi:glucan biosynthesis protein
VSIVVGLFDVWLNVFLARRRMELHLESANLWKSVGKKFVLTFFECGTYYRFALQIEDVYSPSAGFLLGTPEKVFINR